MSIETILTDTKKRMKGAIETLKKEMATVRTGRANASLLDSVQVEYYGAHMPLTQIASVSVPEPSMLVIAPFDKSAMKAIETAILKSELGLNPSNDGQVIRLPIPALTQERRKELTKVVHKMAEEIKTAIRNVRRDGNELVKTLQKGSKITEDERDQGVEEIQKLTDTYIKKVDDLVTAKEKDILAV